MRGVEGGGEASIRDKKFILPPFYQAFFSVGDVNQTKLFRFDT